MTTAPWSKLDDVLAALPAAARARRRRGAGTVEPRDPRGDPLLAIPPTVYVPVLVGTPLNRDRKVSCPFHDDRTPSLHAYGRGRGWRCFGCGACGSIFDLAARLWGLRTRGRDFRELRRGLATTFDVPDGAFHRAAGHHYASERSVIAETPACGQQWKKWLERNAGSG